MKVQGRWKIGRWLDKVKYDIKEKGPHKSGNKMTGKERNECTHPISLAQQGIQIYETIAVTARLFRTVCVSILSATNNVTITYR